MVWFNLMLRLNHLNRFSECIISNFIIDGNSPRIKKSPIKGILICLNDVSIKVIHLTSDDYCSFD